MFSVTYPLADPYLIENIPLMILGEIGAQKKRGADTHTKASLWHWILKNITSPFYAHPCWLPLALAPPQAASHQSRRRSGRNHTWGSLASGGSWGCSTRRCSRSWWWWARPRVPARRAWSWSRWQPGWWGRFQWDSVPSERRSSQSEGGS